MEEIYKAQGRQVPVKNIVFTVKELLALLNSNTLQRGDVILFDELGVAANARKWMTETNMALNYLVQTFRYLNLTILFSCPSFDYIDIAVRKMFHGLINTQKIIKSKKVCRTKFFRIEFNPVYGKLYMKYPFDITGEQLRVMEFGLASKELRKVYEEMQQKYKALLSEELNSKIGSAPAKEEEKGEDYRLEISKKKQKNTKRFEEVKQIVLKQPEYYPSREVINYEFPELTIDEARILRGLISKRKKHL